MLKEENKGQVLSNIKEKVLNYLKNELLLEPIQEQQSRNEYSLLSQIKKARNEWEQAKSYFEQVVDPDLVDHAIYAMEAAEKKYMYLLGKARKEAVIDEEIYQMQEKEMG